MIRLFAVTMLFTLSACGVKGPLTLEGAASQTQEKASPAATQAKAAEATPKVQK